MSAQVIAALLQRADQLDRAAMILASGRPADWKPASVQEDPEIRRWLAGELRSVARLAQDEPVEQLVTWTHGAPS